MEPLTTKVSIAQSYGRNIGNLILEDAKFFGRPNFRGEMDDFKDDRRKFNVMIPGGVVDQLLQIGWNVKTLEARNPDEEPVSFLKVYSHFWPSKEHPNDVEYEQGPDVWIIRGEQREKLTSKTVGLLDRARFETIDMEIRGYEYDRDAQPGKYAAYLVMLVAVMRPNILDDKYGHLR